MAELLPLNRIGEYVHVGSKTTYGQRRYEVSRHVERRLRGLREEMRFHNSGIILGHKPTIKMDKLVILHGTGYDSMYGSHNGTPTGSGDDSLSDS